MQAQVSIFRVLSVQFNLKNALAGRWIMRTGRRDMVRGGYFL
jgi:hypothetical protein